MTNEEGWEDMDLHDPAAVHPIIKFLKFIDQEDMQFKLEEALTNAILEGLKVHMAQVERTAEFDKEMAKSKPPVKLDTGDDEDQDVTRGGTFDAPLGPGQVAEKRKMKLQDRVSKIVREALSKSLKEEDNLLPKIKLSELIGVIMTDEAYSISDILQAIRIECGVAVIDILSASVTKGNWKFTEISIKFEPLPTTEEYIIMLGRKIPKIAGVKKVKFARLNKEV